MIKYLHFFVSATIFLLLVTGCKNEKKSGEVDKKNSIVKTETGVQKNFSLQDFLTEDSLLNAKVNSVFESLSDSERVAQMIITSSGNNGKPFETVNRLLLNKKAGGVIFMNGSRDSFKNLSSKFDSAVIKSKSLPLFYAVDGEPGFVESRIKNTSKFPPQSKIKSKQEADSVAGKISKILKELRLNVNFAPVCDVSVNKEIISDRSFGSDMKKISEYASAFIASTQKNNIIATAKHFPGHGNVKGDSHKELVYIDGNLTELETFENVIKTGVTAVMVGHIAVKNNPEYGTDGLPSSMSKKIVTDLLRKKLGFKGLIVTDALNMNSVTKFEKPALKAAMAGCDILLMPTDEVKLINSVIAEISKDKEFKSQVYDSVKRIIKAKICLGLIKN